MRGKPSWLLSTIVRNASARNRMTVLKVNHKKIVKTSMAISRRSKIALQDFWNLGIWRVVSNYPQTLAKVLNEAPLCFNLAAQPAKKKTKIVATKDRKSTRLNSSHSIASRMPSSA